MLLIKIIDKNTKKMYYFVQGRKMELLIMHEIKSLLSQFVELYNMQDTLTKLTSKKKLYGYGFTEMHCIEAIGILKYPNVTKLAGRLSITTSAMSKVIKKLIKNGDIISFQVENNKKEIYYQLTQKGKIIFDEHSIRHAMWEKRDLELLLNFDLEELRLVSNFLERFNKALKTKIDSF